MLSDDDLRVIETVRDCGSLNKAARRLGRSPSGVSAALRQLEERLDALLFDRSRHRLTLTPAGEVLAREGHRLIEESARLAKRVSQVARGWEDRLHIVKDELLEFETLMPLIADFDLERSGVALRITAEVLGGTWEALLDRRADLVIGATEGPPAHAGLHWHELGSMAWVFAISPRHPLATVEAPLSSDAIRAHRAVVVADSSSAGRRRTYGVLPGQTVLAVPTMTAKAAAQVEGLGIGWLPRHRAASLLQRGLLLEREVQVPREPNLLYLGWRQESEGRALRWWLERLKDDRLSQRLLEGVPWS